MDEVISVAQDGVKLVECRARVADTHAHVALLDGVVMLVAPPRSYAANIHSARLHLEAALSDLDSARAITDACTPEAE